MEERMDLGECVGVVVVVSALLLGPAPVIAGDVAQGDFSVGWEPHLVGGREAAVKGYVENHSRLQVGDVHLRVETLEEDGRVIGEAFGWVVGDVPAGGRGYFVVRVAVPGGIYRVTVESYDAISTATAGQPGPAGAPAASPPTSP
jgi:hypothetical protein